MRQDTPLYILDGHSYLYKAFFAIKGLMTKEGIPTNATFGFISTLNRLLAEYEPSRIIIAFDYPAPTFRKALYEAYKANRPKMPDDLAAQIPWIKRTLDSMGIAHVEKEGFEADDLIGTLARRAQRRGIKVFIVSIDKDLFQLVSEGISVLHLQKDSAKTLDAPQVKEKLKVFPEFVTDFLGLVGDSSDNIPGVPSIGPVTASKLINQFGSLESIISHCDEIESERHRDLIIEHKDQALLSKRLATIDCDVPLDIEVAEIRKKSPNNEELARIFKQLEFRSLLESLGSVAVKREVDYKTITDADELVSYLDGLGEGDILSFDTETTSTDAMQADLVGISLSYSENIAVYIPLGHVGDLISSQNQLALDQVRNILGPVLANPKIKKTAHNLKYDVEILERHGFCIEGGYFDTMIASYVLNPGRGRHSLKILATDLLGITMTPISELIGKGSKQISMAMVDIEKASRYSCMDADVTFLLTALFEKKLQEENLSDIFFKIEIPLVEVLKTMERTGISIDKEHFQPLSGELGEKLSVLEKDIYEIVGHEFNINSPKQLSEVLFNELNLKPVKSTKTGHSTDVSVLEVLSSEHELPIKILEYRSIDKLKSTYVDALPKLVNPHTGRIHSSFNQTIAATGRLSSSNPNLQNIPVRTPEGREIRKGFVPSGENRLFVSADYSQIELRILAHISQDQVLIDAFNSGQDIHRLTASKVFGVPEEEVEPSMRSQAKTINFGIIYGMSAHRLAQSLKIPRTKAKAFIDEYFNVYRGVKKYIDDTIALCKKDGFVKTLLGRKRFIPEINSSNFNVRGSAERIAINTPIQGTAADMIKIAMINIHKEIVGRKLETEMLLQVHDELIFESPMSEIEVVKDMVRTEMEGALSLSVPVVVDVKTGSNWAEAK